MFYHFLKVVLSFALTAAAAQADSSCEKVENYGQAAHKEGRLTPFWAQELIGADLVRSEFELGKTEPALFFTLEPIDLNEIPNEMLTDGLLDCKLERSSDYRCRRYQKFRQEHAGKCEHGNAVAQLVAGPAAGAAANAKLAAVATTLDYSDEAVLQDALAKGVRLLCGSQKFSGPEHGATLGKFRQAGGILLQSAGNDFPDLSYQEFPKLGINVSSLSPFGLVSNFSSPIVSGVPGIAAPSDEFVLAGRADLYAKFGGTSGAQPLVCGTVANLLSLLPGLTQDEVWKILKSTALPTVNSRDPSGKNGVGTVNAYRAFQVAKRLKEGWPGNRLRIETDDALYDFRREAVEKLRSARLALPSPDHCKSAQGFRHLRSAFLLHPQDSQILTQLRQEYKRLGYTINASLLAFFSSPPSKGQFLRMAESHDGDLRQASIRALAENNFTSAQAAVRKHLEGRSTLGRTTLEDAKEFCFYVKILRILGISPSETKELVGPAYERRGASFVFLDYVMDQLAYVQKLDPKWFVKGCMSPPRDKIPYSCYSAGLQRFRPPGVEVNQETFVAFLQLLHGRLSTVPHSEELAADLKHILEQGEVGRAFLAAESEDSRNGDDLRLLVKRVLEK